MQHGKAIVGESRDKILPSHCKNANKAVLPKQCRKSVVICSTANKSPEGGVNKKNVAIIIVLNGN